MDVTPRGLRQVMSRFATGVAVVATTDPLTRKPLALTANSLCSVSLDPPLISVCVAKRAQTHDAIRASMHFSVNVLAEEQRDLSGIFAKDGCTDKFARVPHDLGGNGIPLLRRALAWLECSVWAMYPGGDHTIFVGRVLTASHGMDGKPLVFYGGTYESLESESPLSITAA